MRKSALYLKLAWGNLVRNRQFFLPYLLTLAGTAAAFYIIAALASARDLPLMLRYQYLLFFMNIGLAVVALFAVIFLSYTNSFLRKRRSRELGLYNILGMGKIHIARMLGLETAITALIGIGSGLALGLLLQKLVTLLLFRVMGGDVRGFAFFVSARGIGYTVALFSGILLWDLIRVGRQSPMELLRSASAGEQEPKSRRLLAALGVLSLSGGYGIALNTEGANTALSLYFPAVFLVILGTYALFSAVSIVVLKTLRRRKQFYYRLRHFIGISGMLHRMRRNAVGLANICVLSTMVLVMVSGTLSLYLNSRAALEGQFPGNTVVTVRYDPTEEDPFDSEAMETVLLSAIRELGYPAEPVGSYRMLSLQMLSTEGGYTRLYYYSDAAVELMLLTAEEAALLLGEAPSDYAAVTLRFPLDQEAMTGEAGGTYRELTISAAPITGEVPAAGGSVADTAEPVWMVVENETVLRAVLAAGAESCKALDQSRTLMTWRSFYQVEAGEEALLTLNRAVEDAMGWWEEPEMSVGSWMDFKVETQPGFESDYFSINGGFFFLGLFLGILFLMAALLIIYYKQVTEGYEDRERYRIMQEVGLEENMVRQSIRSQILVVFFAPLLVTALHVAFDFRMMLQLLRLFVLYETNVTFLCTVGTFLVFALVYGLVYRITARTYYRIVRR